MLFIRVSGTACPPEAGPRCASPGGRRNGAALALRAGGGCDGAEVNHHLGCSAFAEHAVVSRRSLVKVDPELPLEEAALFGCAVLTGVGAVVNTARVQAGASVAVIGLGGVGLASLLGAAAAGARRIVAVDLSDEKLAGTALGGTETGRTRYGRGRAGGARRPAAG